MARPLGNLQEECFNQEVVFTSRSARNKRVECGDSKVTKKRKSRTAHDSTGLETGPRGETRTHTVLPGGF